MVICFTKRQDCPTLHPAATLTSLAHDAEDERNNQRQAHLCPRSPLTQLIFDTYLCRTVYKTIPARAPTQKHNPLKSLAQEQPPGHGAAERDP